MKLGPRLDSVYIYLLTAMIGYMVADLAILSYRESLLPQPVPGVIRRPPPPRPAPDKGSYGGILAHNIFNADGKIPPILGAGEGTDPTRQDAPPVPSQLPIALTGTIVHVDPERSVATINLKNKNDQRAYRTGDDIEGLAKITKVERNKVILRNNNTQKLEFIEIKDDVKLNFGAAPVKQVGEVTVLGDKDFSLKRDDVNRLTGDLPSILQQARAIPNTGPDGQANGFRIMDIQPGSIYERLGLKQGDVIKSVNGEKVDSPQKAMELYNALKSSNNIRLGLERNGKDDDFNFNITQ